MNSNKTTPRLMAQRIIRLVQRGDDNRDNELHESDVIRLVIDSSNKVMKAETFANRGVEGSKSPMAHYIHTYRQIPVKKLSHNGFNFIDLPSNYASLPMNAGVQRIAPDTENPYDNDAMIPVQNNELDIFRDILGQMQSQWVYYVEGARAYFYKRCEKTLCESDINYVTLTIVAALGSINPDSEIQAPPEYFQQIINEVLQQVDNTYGIGRDGINDNNPAQDE